MQGVQDPLYVDVHHGMPILECSTCKVFEDAESGIGNGNVDASKVMCARVHGPNVVFDIHDIKCTCDQVGPEVCRKLVGYRSKLIFSAGTAKDAVSLTRKEQGRGGADSTACPGDEDIAWI